MNTTKKYKRILIPAAACLTAAIALLAVLFVPGGFGKTYTAHLENGEAVSYKKTAVGSASIDFGYAYEITSRELTAGELRSLSPLLTSGFGIFRKDTGALVHFEGNAGETKVIMAAPGVPVTDTVIDEFPKENTVCGVPVLCGYCIANNAGRPVALFSGEFRCGGITVYVERAAAVRDAEAACKALSDVLLQFIQNGEPDLDSVTP